MKQALQPPDLLHSVVDHEAGADSRGAGRSTPSAADGHVGDATPRVPPVLG
jgi:hypothetical protein